MKGKRFILLAALVAGTLIPASANAQKWVWESVTWRTQSTSFISLNVDSSVACGAAAARLDTTAAIYIGDWALAPGKSSLAAVDSTLFAIFKVVGGGAALGITDAFDSLYCSVQVSHDGNNWALATPRWGGFIGFNTTTNRGGYEIDDVTNSFGFHFKSLYGAANSYSVLTGSATAPDWWQLFGWSYVRFIVRSGAGTGCYSARVGHWVWQ